MDETPPTAGVAEISIARYRVVSAARYQPGDDITRQPWNESMAQYGILRSQVNYKLTSDATVGTGGTPLSPP